MAATVVIAIAGFTWRAAQVPGDVEVVERQTRSIDHLFDLVDQTGPERLLACQDRVRMTHVREQTALTWDLEEPIAKVLIRYRPKQGIAISTKPIPGGNLIAHAGRWRATNLPCPAYEASSRARPAAGP